VTERVIIEFTCKRRGHMFATVVKTATGDHEVVIPSTAYTDLGPRPGTVRVKRLNVEQRMPVETADVQWSLTVLCACGARRFLTVSMVELQLREWRKFNALSGQPRRIWLENPA
jgi:hypothetical protein